MGTYNYVPIVNPNIDITSAINNANNAYRTAIDFLDELDNYIPMSSYEIAETAFDGVTPPVIDFDPGETPDAPDRDIQFDPNFPSVPNLTEVDKSGLSVTVPTFTGTAPVLDDIENPGALDVSAPGDAPDVDFNFTDPTSPDYTLPSVPTFQELDIPSLPTITQYEFTADAPTDENIQIPGNTFSFSESEYHSNLVDAVTAELIDRVQNGGTGLNPTIENAIWERAKDREEKESMKTIDTILSKNASRGFQRPPGSVLAAIDEATQEVQGKIADLSREIAIKQADLEQSNIKHAIEQAIVLEQVLINLHNDVQNRALEVQKYIQQTAIAIFEASVQQFSVRLQAYKTAADVFETQVRAELTKAEVYKAQIEGVKAQVDINDSKVRLYVSQIEGIRQIVEIYKAEWSAVETKVRAEAAKLEGFRSQVDAYTAQVGAYQAEVGAYAERVKAEVAKADVFDSQVKAYASQVQAYASQVDAGKVIADTDIEVNKLTLQHTLGKIEAIVKNTQAQAAVFNAEVDKFRSEVQAYSADISKEEVRSRVLQNIFELQLQQAKYKADVDLKNTDQNIANARNAAELLLEKLKSGASIGSGLVAASMSGINMSLSESLSASHVETHTYQEK